MRTKRMVLTRVERLGSLDRRVRRSVKMVGRRAKMADRVGELRRKASLGSCFLALCFLGVAGLGGVDVRFGTGSSELLDSLLNLRVTLRSWLTGIGGSLGASVVKVVIMADFVV